MTQRRRRGLPTALRTGVHALLAAAAALACATAVAQGAFSIVPSVSVSATATDNRDLSSSRREADLVTQVSPGIAIASRRGALQGSLNYSLNGVVYARDSALNNVFHTLAANGRLSLLDGRAGVEASASAGRQIVSAQGTQSPDANLGLANQAQVVSYSLSPYLTGRLLGNVTYRTRLVYSESRSDAANAAGDTTSLNVSAGLSGRLAALGWGLDAVRAISETPTTARTHNGRIVGSLSHQPDPEVQLFLRAGTEVDDIRTGRSERTTIWGVGAHWTPGPRTSLRADYDQRFFGRSHALIFSHRMARTIWTLGDTRSFETGGVGGRAVVSAYDLFFAQFASVEPDPVRRDALVRSFLAANGLDPGGRVVTGGFLTSGPTVQRNQNVTAAYQGLRATITLSLLRTESRSAVEADATGGDTANGNRVKQQGLSVSLSHRLTPDSSFVVSASQQHTPSSGNFGGSDLQSIVATWSTRLGTRASASLSLRHNRYDSDTNPYHESAVIGSLRMQF